MGPLLPVPTFVGRASELAWLRALAAAASGRRGQIAVLTGEAGIGKSRLVTEALASVGPGCRVLSAGADELEPSRPFGVLLDALGVDAGNDETRGEVVSLLHAPGGFGAGRGLEARLSDLLAAIVGAECRSGPTAVVLDDLQWADESSMVAIHRIAHLAADHPLLLVCIARPYPAGRPLRSLLAALDYRGAHRVELHGLAEVEVAELAASIAGAPVGTTMTTALARTGGNPFYVSELMAALLVEGEARPAVDGADEPASGSVPTSLRMTLLQELRYLPDDTLEVLRAAAVAGRSFALDEVALLAPSRVPDVAAAIRPAEQAQIVLPDGDRLCFRHDLLREAVYEDMAPAVRRGLHRYLAARLAESGADPDRVAAQLMLGADPGDATAAEWLRRAAAKVASKSPAIAVDLLAKAAELIGASGPGRVEVLRELVRPLLWTGRAEQAEEVCLAGLRRSTEEEGDPLFWVGLVTARLLQGRFADARAAVDGARRGNQLTESDRLCLDTLHALCGLYLGDPEAVALARQIAATAPNSISRGSAQEALAQWELIRGRPDRALIEYQKVDAMRSPEVVPNPIWSGSGIRVRMWEGLSLLHLDRIDEAVELLDQEISARLSVPGLPHAYLAACCYHAGRFDQAVVECRAAVGRSEAAGSLVPAEAPALASVIALRRGQQDEAARFLCEAERVKTPAHVGSDAVVRWARTLLLEAALKAEEAADEAAAAVDAHHRNDFPSYLSWHAPDFVRVLRRAGRAEQARHAVEVAERVADELPVGSRRAAALRARGLLDSDAGVLLEAVEVGRTVTRPVDLALSLRDAAVALARNGDLARARPLANEALSTLRVLGAAGDERVALHLLRGAGLSPGPRARHTKAVSGWDSLTTAEHRVVELVAQGRSNPEIAARLYLSRRTVGWHLSNVFRKLGASSRAELAAEAVRRQLG